MKSKDEVQRAHDVLLAIILKEVPVRVPPEQMEMIGASAAVLCWVLGDKHNPSFQQNLDRIEELFQQMNIQEVRTITN